MGRNDKVWAAATMLLLTGVLGCSDRQALVDAVTREPEAVGLSLNVSDLTLNAGEAVQLMAASREALGSGLSWSSSAPDVAQVDQSGRVVGVAPGLATVSVRRGSETVRATVRVSLERLGKSGLALWPEVTELAVGGESALELMLVDQEGRPVQYESADRWIVTDPSVVEVRDGVVTAVGEGESEVIAVSGELTARSLIRIKRFPKPQISSLDPSALHAGSGDQMLRVQGKNFQPGSQVVVDNEPVATTYVSSTEVRAVMPAAWLSTAASRRVWLRTSTGLVSNTVGLTVTGSTQVAQIDMSATVVSVVVGNAVQLIATPRDAAGNAVSTTVTWSTSAGPVATVSGNGLVTGVSAGTATITASAGGASATVQVTVIGANPLPQPQTLEPSLATAGSGAFLLRVMGSGFMNGSVVRWNGAARPTTYVSAGEVHASIAAGDVATAGTASITVMNPAPGGGISPAVSFTIAQTAPTVATVTISPASLTMTVGDTARITAVARDAQGNVVSGRPITFGTANAAVATVSTSGLVRALANGTTVVGASIDGQIGTTPVQVQTVVLPAPGNLTATAVSTTQINLSWSAVSGAAAYLVYRNGTQIATVTGTTTSDTGLQAGTQYSYTVRARDAAGVLGTSTTPVSATTQATGPLPAPGNVVASAVTSSRIDVSWGAVAGAQAYLVYRNGVLVQTVTATNVSDTGLQASTSYTYTVRARDAAGVLGATSAGASATTPAQAPAVASLVASPGSYQFREMGETVQVIVTARDALGQVVLNPQLTWSSTNTGIATVSSTGVITPRAVGTGSIIVRATCCTAADTIPVTVLPPPDPGASFFSDDFESYVSNGNIQGQGAGTFRWGGANYARVTNEISRSGGRSLKFFFGPTEPDGSSHWWSEQRFDLGQLVTDLWIEFYIYLPNGNEGLGSAPYIHNGTQNNKLTSLWGYLNSAPSNDGAGYNNAAFILFQTWGINGGPDAAVNLNVQDRYPGGTTPIFTTARRGTWVQWRQHSRMSSARGVADGLVEYWINGVLGQRHANIVVQPTDTSFSHGWRHGYLMGYDNARFTQNTWIYIDDVSFYTSNPGW